MRDPDIVAAVVAGDPAGLAAAYEKYAAPLYTYCRSMLRDADDAADALQDTFVVASQKLDGLRDHERLRSWLYAVARNECLRLLRARNRTVELTDSDDMSDDSIDVTETVRQEELRDLVRAAFEGLNAGDREILDLSLRHELSGVELGEALGVPVNHAHALLSRARGQMEVALGALLVARSGSRDCAQLAELLADWDGRFNTLIRKRVNRHIEACDVCRERRRGELTPAMLLGLGPILLVPPQLRAKILQLCADESPEGKSRRVRTGQRAEPFDQITGFPVQLGGRRRPPMVRWRTALTAATVLVLLLGLTTAAVALHWGPFTKPITHKSDAAVVEPAATDLVISISASAVTSPSQSKTSASPSHSATPTLIVTPITEPPTSAQPQNSVQPPPPPPSTTPPSSPPSSPSPPPPPPPSLSLTGTPISMDGPRVTGYFEITALGGTVNYTITLPPNPPSYGSPVVTPSQGTLANGQSQVVSIKISSDWPSATTDKFTMTVDPGNIQVFVNWN